MAYEMNYEKAKALGADKTIQWNIDNNPFYFAGGDEAQALAEISQNTKGDGSLVKKVNDTIMSAVSSERKGSHLADIIAGQSLPGTGSEKLQYLTADMKRQYDKAITSGTYNGLTLGSDGFVTSAKEGVSGGMESHAATMQRLGLPMAGNGKLGITGVLEDYNPGKAGNKFAGTNIGLGTVGLGVTGAAFAGAALAGASGAGAAGTAGATEAGYAGTFGATGIPTTGGTGYIGSLGASGIPTYSGAFGASGIPTASAGSSSFWGSIGSGIKSIGSALFGGGGQGAAGSAGGGMNIVSGINAIKGIAGIAGVVGGYMQDQKAMEAQMASIEHAQGAAQQNWEAQQQMIRQGQQGSLAALSEAQVGAQGALKEGHEGQMSEYDQIIAMGKETNPQLQFMIDEYKTQMNEMAAAKGQFRAGANVEAQGKGINQMMYNEFNRGRDIQVAGHQLKGGALGEYGASRANLTTGYGQDVTNVMMNTTGQLSSNRASLSNAQQTAAYSAGGAQAASHMGTAGALQGMAGQAIKGMFA